MNKPVPPKWLARFPEGMPAVGDRLPSLLGAFRVLRRRKGILIGTTVLLTVIAAIAVTRLTPLYTAQTMIVLEPQVSGQVLDIGAMVAGLPADTATIETEIEVLRSWGFAQTVIESLRLQNDPDLNPSLEQPSAWSRLVDSASVAVDSFVYDLFGWSPMVEWGGTTVQPVGVNAISTDIVKAFLERREITTLGNSRAVQISYTSTDPATAARVAQAMADLYIVERLEGRFDATRRISEWLSQRVGQLRAEVEAKEQAVENYRTQNDLVSGEQGVALINEEISQLNAQLVEAQAARTEAEARLWQIQSLMQQGNAATADAVLDSPLIQGLRQEEARLQALVSEYSTRYSDEHPTMRDAKAQLQNVGATIDREIEKIAQGLANTAAVARSREVALREQLADIKGRVGTSNIAEVELRSLELEAQSARDLLEIFLQQFNASAAQEDIIAQRPDARIISRADVPQNPSFPATRAILALSFLSALAAGVGLALLRELLDNSFRSSSELESEVGIRVIGHVPWIRNRAARRRGLADAVVRTPSSIEAEAVRRICVAISMARKRGVGNRILFASAQPGEGKTSISTSVARMLATSGQRVLLIDADIHRPTVHTRLGLKRQAGLAEVVLEDVPLEDVVEKDERSGAWVLQAGKLPSRDTYRLFTSEGLAQLLDKAGSDYDAVLIDSPPVSAVSDVLPLSQLAATIFVVRWGGAPKAYIRTAVRELVDSGAQVLGLVLAQVDVDSHVKYGYGDAGGYMREVRKYYANA